MKTNRFFLQKKKLFVVLSLFLFLVLNATNIHAQIWEGSYFIESQADVDSFPMKCNCTEITEYLRIRGEHITNLDGLNNLTSIGGDLQIWHNPVLININGLNNLTSIGKRLNISNNNILTKIDGLNNLTSIGGNLEISWNDALTHISGLNKLVSVKVDVNIKQNHALTNINGLNSLTSVGKNFSIEHNIALTNIDGLSSLMSIGKRFNIWTSHALTNLNGLNSLTFVGEDLEIYWNSTLTNIDELNNLTSVGGDLNIFANKNLSACCLIECWYINDIVKGVYRVEANTSGCNALIEIEDACDEDKCNIVSYESLSLPNLLVDIYPNPVQGLVNISLGGISALQNGKLYLHDPTGRLIHTQKISTNEKISLHTINMIAGIYILKIDLGKGEKPIFRKLMIAPFK